MKLKYVPLLLLCVAGLSAQPYAPPDTLWTRILHQPEVGDVDAQDMVFIPNGQFLVSGRISGIPGEALFLMSLDPAGDVMWQTAIGYPPDHVFSTGQMCQTSANRFVVTGVRIGDYGDAYAVLMDENGDSLWRRSYGLPDEQWVDAVCPTGDGGFLLVYQSFAYPNGEESIGWMKVDSLGDTLWTGSCNNPGHRIGASAATLASNGSLAIAGTTGEESNPDILLVVLNPDGSLLFNRSYGTNVTEGAWDVTALENGNFLIGGLAQDTSDPNNPIQPYALCVDADGDSLWHWIWETPPDGYGIVTRVLSAPGGGVTLHCKSSAGSPTPVNASYLIRLDAYGVELWRTTLLFTLPYKSVVDRCVAQDDQGQYILVGKAGTEDGSHTDEVLGMMLTQADPALSAGRHHSVALHPTTIEVNIYPNPFNSQSRLTFNLPRAGKVGIDLYNLAGQKVRTIVNQDYAPGEHAVMLNGDGLASGIYFVRVEAGAWRQTKKIVMMK